MIVEPLGQLALLAGLARPCVLEVDFESDDDYFNNRQSLLNMSSTIGATHEKRADGEEEEDTDAIFAELEAEVNDTNSADYQQRLRELQESASSSVGQQNTTSGKLTGSLRQDSYFILKSDDETLRFTTEHEKAIVHFRHPDFARCSIMDEHLDRIAQQHTHGESSGEGLVFARVDVQNAPFVVEKLGVRVLPCVIGFSEGIAKGKIIGFEGICWDGKEKDQRVTRALEGQLLAWGLLKQKMLSNDNDESDEDVSEVKQDKGMSVRRGIKDRKHQVMDEDDDWD